MAEMHPGINQFLDKFGLSLGHGNSISIRPLQTLRKRCLTRGGRSMGPPACSRSTGEGQNRQSKSFFSQPGRDEWPSHRSPWGLGLTARPLSAGLERRYARENVRTACISPDRAAVAVQVVSPAPPATRAAIGPSVGTKKISPRGADVPAAEPTERGARWRNDDTRGAALGRPRGATLARQEHWFKSKRKHFCRIGRTSRPPNETLQNPGVRFRATDRCRIP